jgi:hypothetical protein
VSLKYRQRPSTTAQSSFEGGDDIAYEGDAAGYADNNSSNDDDDDDDDDDDGDDMESATGSGSQSEEEEEEQASSDSDSYSDYGSDDSVMGLEGRYRYVFCSILYVLPSFFCCL